jgi:hypothetical protein
MSEYYACMGWGSTGADIGRDWQAPTPPTSPGVPKQASGPSSVVSWTHSNNYYSHLAQLAKMARMAETEPQGTTVHTVRLPAGMWQRLQTQAAQETVARGGGTTSVNELIVVALQAALDSADGKITAQRAGLVFRSFPTSTKPSNVTIETPVPEGSFYSDDNPFGSGDRQEESAIASDEATAVVTKTVRSTKPKADDFEKTRRPGEYSASEMADIDAERLARMKTGKRK